MSIQVKVVKPQSLTAQERAVWTLLRETNPALYSPYFHIGYTDIIGELRDDVYVAVMCEGDQPVAFLPFQGPQPGKSGFARPIGAPMTDYHGFIQAAGSSYDYIDILRQAGIGAFHFNALIGDMGLETSERDEACVMSLPDGAKVWREAQGKSYRRHMKSLRRRIRKTEEDIGPRRFEFKIRDENVFDQLINWKREKFALTGKYDVLSVGWTQTLLKRLWESDGDLRCDLHALYFGDTLAAIDLGLTDGATFHSWMVAYNSEHYNLSPGIQLLEGLLDVMPDHGYGRLDLGVGLDGYKKHYATDKFDVSSGFVAVKGPAAALSQLYGKAETFGKKSLKDAPGKLRRRYSQIAACDESFSGRTKAMLEAFSAPKPNSDRDTTRSTG